MNWMAEPRNDLLLSPESDRETMFEKKLAEDTSVGRGRS